MNKSGIRNRRSEMKRSGLLFIVSAPSGTGKTTLCRKAVDYFPDLRHSISYTTRPPRKDEKDGIDYHFVSQDVFQEMLDGKEFLEWAEVHGNRYGTSLNDIQSLLNEGLDAILDIDVQGAAQVKKKIDFGVFIFVLPPSLKACEERIRNRGKDSPEAMVSRLENAKREIKEAVWYEYIIINDKLDDAFEKLKSIVIAEKSKRERVIDQVKRLYGEALGGI